MDLDEQAHNDLIQQFGDISGVDAAESRAHITSLLTVNNWNLNNAISIYFDSGFELIEHSNGPESPTHDSEHFHQQNGDNAVASGLEEHESNAVHRGDQRHIVNLQNQMFFDNYIPKLPKAPKLSSMWQLEIGIHMSMKEHHEKESGAGASDAEKTPVSVLRDDGLKGSQSSNPGANRTSPLWIILLFIPKSLLSILVSIFRYFFGFVGGSAARKIDLNTYPREFDYTGYDPRYESEYTLNVSENKADDEREDEDKSLTNSNAFGAGFGPDVVHSNFNEIHAHCQSKYAWLLVVLNNNEANTNTFVKAFTSSPLFHKLSDTEIYINNCERSREAFEVGHTYRVKKLPYVMLIGNVTNNPSVMSAMSMVYKTNIPEISLVSQEMTDLTVKKVYKGLHKVMEHYTPQLITQRLDQQEIEFSRLIKEQQDAAYIESLAKDKQRKQQKEVKAQQQRDQLQRKQIRDRFLREKLSSKWTSHIVHESKGPGGTRIAIKLPNGKRTVEMFDKLVSTNELYLYAELKIFEEQEQEESEQNEQNKQDSQKEAWEDVRSISDSEYWAMYPFRFELLQPFPKKVIEAGGAALGEVAELKSGGNLLVEYLNEDEDEDDEEHEHEY